MFELFLAILLCPVEPLELFVSSFQIIPHLGNDQGELWLLRLLWLFADTLHALSSVQTLTPQLALDPATLRAELLKAARQHRYDDVILLAYLFRLLTGEDRTGAQALGKNRSRSGQDEAVAKVMQAHVLAARLRLRDNMREGYFAGSATVNRSAAHMLFRWAFEDCRPHAEPASAHSHPPLDAGPHLPERSGRAEASDKDDVVDDDADDEDFNDDNDDDEEESSRKQRTGESASSVSRDSLQARNHVTVVYESRDPSCTRVSRVVQNVLRHICGLQVWRAEEKMSEEEKEKEVSSAASRSRVILFVINSNGLYRFGLVVMMMMMMMMMIMMMMVMLMMMMMILMMMMSLGGEELVKIKVIKKINLTVKQ
jgi:hypothetical protein